LLAPDTRHDGAEVLPGGEKNNAKGLETTAGVSFCYFADREKVSCVAKMLA
jgi:hypothetical protein